MASSSPPSVTLAALFLAAIALSLISPSHSQSTCLSQTFTNNRHYSFCNDLPSLNSYLHWDFDPTTLKLSIAFIAAPAAPNGWVSWALNPTSTGMIGSQALIAFREANGQMKVQTYNVTSYGPLVKSTVLYEVTQSSAEFSGGMIRLFATLVLPKSATTTMNQVWQVGSSVTNGLPDKHAFQPGNLNSKGSFNILSGQVTPPSGGSGNSRMRRGNIHGILNVVSWGILFPIGVIIARYLRTFQSADPAWFYLHALCQTSAYAIGVAGWATGLKLGSESRGIVHYSHRNIGIALFTLATVQIFALFLRPGKDHKFRFYWNIYHHSFGYTIFILGVINVFKGFAILNPDPMWRRAYTILIIALGAISIFLEVFTWCIVLRRKKSANSTKPYDGLNNGHGRQEP